MGNLIKGRMSPNIVIQIRIHGKDIVAKFYVEIRGFRRHWVR
jgi:hypothetical protein